MFQSGSTRSFCLRTDADSKLLTVIWQESCRVWASHIWRGLLRCTSGLTSERCEVQNPPKVLGGRNSSSNLCFVTSNANHWLALCRQFLWPQCVTSVSIFFFLVPQRVIVWRGVVSVEVFPQTQGGSELWSGLPLLHPRLVSHRLCRPAAPPSAWSVCSRTFYHTQ